MSAKELKEAFVSGSNGTTVLETVWVSLSITLGPMLYTSWRRGYGDKWGPVGRGVTEFLTLVGPLLVAFTVTPGMSVVYLLCVVGAVVLFVLKRKAPPTKTSTESGRPSGVRLPFLDSYRSMMMLATCLCILAVDFTVFPRRFGKTETFGISLMDVGVGCFVFSAGVAFQIRRVFPVGTNERQEGVLLHAARQLWQRVGQAAPLVVLGVGRLLAVRGVDYHEHVTEYGVHWNFFLTLAALPFLSLITDLSLPRRFPAGVAGLVVLTVYQVVLVTTPLTEWVLGDDRSDLIAMNKEGLVSCIGYFALYDLGKGVGAAGCGYRPKRVWKPFAVLTIIATVVTVILHWTVQPVSRRMCNATYVGWMVAYNSAFLSAFASLDRLRPGSGYLLSGINFNALPLFLVANLLTGATNLTVDTIQTPPFAAFLILTLYMAVVCGLGGCLYAWRIKVRLH